MKFAFLIPIYTSVSAKLFPQFLSLQRACEQIDAEIFTVSNRTHVDARNWLATNGGGFENPRKFIEEVEWLVWIDSDQGFSLKNLETLLNCEEKFCSGWYVKEDASGLPGNHAMAARWDEEYFEKHGNMEFLTADELNGSKEEFVEVDYVGFGFTKVHTDLLKQMEYPYFRQKVVKVGKYKENTSEDVTFCRDCYEITGVKPKVITQLRIGHLKEIFI